MTDTPAHLEARAAVFDALAHDSLAYQRDEPDSLASGTFGMDAIHLRVMADNNRRAARRMRETQRGAA